ncbi:N-formylglutamate deformylase [Cupriavidus sp. SW-Y-13]|uniref:N-formylglutamate deformylase n=2 Tax=Burkholderiaceae TaxID=119060 RepID=A0A482J3G3_9BURK|nr:MULTISPECIES: N-formylglutamate deformylase [Cupriavidus]MWL91931.1 N-formylglutamate deformylase [Cupriavidus sp. SW-Y-13]QBP14636.1 N-formylglutamate deformylase [Cupriavidus metallidurans]
MSSSSHPLFTLHRGTAPLLVSIPHLGRHLPESIRPGFSDEAAIVSDTDWHLDQLYGFARELGASVLGATVSRYAIDLNRPPTGESLYPGQTTTDLCPTETFRGVPLYQPGHAPDDAEIARRRAAYWQPYHDALRAELDRLKACHGQVLLWEAHSIASVLPRLFEGKLSDLNFGTNSGAACAPALLDAVLAPLPAAAAAGVTHVVNGRFKGGYITRHYGVPADGVHAIQLEMCQSLYMNETAPFDYRPDLAGRIQPALGAMLGAGLAWLRHVG